MKKLNRAVTILSLYFFHHALLADDIAEKVRTGNLQENNHVVKYGESLFSIAKQYNISVETLKLWNKIKNTDNIIVGQKISLSPNKTNQNLTDRSKEAATESLQQQAKSAINKKNYTLAIKLLNRLYQQGSDAEHKFALEFLGVAREKKGQLAFAKQAYQLFLQKYPQTENASRVKLRLNNLIGIETLSKNRRFKNDGSSNKRRSSSYFRGSLSSDYRHSVLIDDLGNSRKTLSLANVDVDAKGNIDQDDYNVGFRVSLGHYEDLLPYSDRTNEQIRYLSVSASSDDNLYQMTIGRQRNRGKGIFGRFDGLVLSSKILTDIQVNVVAGYPVMSSKVTKLDPEREFYGLSVDVDNSWQDINFSLFFFDQSINDLTDRRAVGGELTYFKDAVSAYALLDYDIFFNELNAFLFSGSFNTETAQRYSWSLNYRKSPYVGTRNALIGQSVDSFAELQDLFINDEEILDLALDRTLTSKTASLQFFQPINENYDISTSLTWMNLSSAPESGGVPAISESGDQLYTNIYLSARKIYSEKDINNFGFRYSSLASSNVYSIYATSRYRFDDGFSVMSKLRFDNRDNDNGTGQQSISPSFRVQYQSKKHYLYSDFGGIFYNSESTLFADQKTSIYFIYLGYRYYFGR
jgi:murein DD-endopeptidase MepM/ murein hydrolase activator NlpD